MKKKEEAKEEPKPVRKPITNRDVFAVLGSLNALTGSGVKINSPAAIHLARIAKKALQEAETIQTAYPKYMEYTKKLQELQGKMQQRPKFGETNTRRAEIDEANQKIAQEADALKAEYKEAIDEADKVLDSVYDGEPLPTIKISRLTNGEGVPIDLSVQISMGMEPILED